MIKKYLVQVFFWFRAWVIRARYRRHLARVRVKVAHGEKVRVLFLDSEVAKWKCQRLFELMRESELFEPVMGVSRRDGSLVEVESGSGRVELQLNQAVAYFEGMGNSCVVVWDWVKGCAIDLRRFQPDIVFLQQPWYEWEPGCWAHSAMEISKFALTAYVPYYVESYGTPDVSIRQITHRALAYYFLQSETWKKALLEGVDLWEYAGRFVATGVPVLGEGCSREREQNGDLEAPRVTAAKAGLAIRASQAERKREPSGGAAGTVCAAGTIFIYAPHWSIPVAGFENFLQLSTFLETGRFMLAYAQAHPEQRWVFKPHPKLKSELVRTGVWRAEEVDAYWASWRKIAEVCETSAYADAFARAGAMVTDCASFLSEFGATGKPVVWLRSRHAKVQPMEPSARLFGTYYSAWNETELGELLGAVVERGEDPRREARLAALKESGLRGVDGAREILAFLTREVKGGGLIEASLPRGRRA